MLHNVPITEIMTEDVETVGPAQPIIDVIDILIEYSVHHVPVAAEGELQGIVSMSDVLGVADTDVAVSTVMQRSVVTINVNDDISTAAALLATGEIHSLPVIDHDNNLVGIVTTTDIVNFVLHQLEAEGLDELDSK